MFGHWCSDEGRGSECGGVGKERQRLRSVRSEDRSLCGVPETHVKRESYRVGKVLGKGLTEEESGVEFTGKETLRKVLVG